MRICMNLNRILVGLNGDADFIRYSRFANVEYKREPKTSRRCCCTEAEWLSKRTSTDLHRGKRSGAQPVGSSWSHSAAEEFQASARCGVKGQTQYLRSRRVFG